MTSVDMLAATNLLALNLLAFAASRVNDRPVSTHKPTLPQNFLLTLLRRTWPSKSSTLACVCGGDESWPFSFGVVVVHSHFCCRFCSYRHLGMTLQGLCRFGIKVMYNGFGFSNLGWAGSRHPRTCHLAGSTCSWTAPGGHARSAWRASRTT